MSDSKVIDVDANPYVEGEDPEVGSVEPTEDADHEPEGTPEGDGDNAPGEDEPAEVELSRHLDRVINPQLYLTV